MDYQNISMESPFSSQSYASSSHFYSYTARFCSSAYDPYYEPYPVHNKWYQSSEVLGGFSALMAYPAEMGPEEDERVAPVKALAEKIVDRFDKIEDWLDKSEARLSDLMTTISNFNKRWSSPSSASNENCKVTLENFENVDGEKSLIEQAVIGEDFSMEVVVVGEPVIVKEASDFQAHQVFDKMPEQEFDALTVVFSLDEELVRELEKPAAEECHVAKQSYTTGKKTNVALKETKPKTASHPPPLPKPPPRVARGLDNTKKEREANVGLALNEQNINFQQSWKLADVGNLSHRTEQCGVKVKELSKGQSPRNHIEETQIVVTTPEKWDIITRKSGSDLKFLELGIYADSHHTTKLVELLRYNSTKMGDELNSLKEHVTSSLLLSHLHIRSTSSLFKFSRIKPVMVTHVDKENGYIDLSKRRVPEKDILGARVHNMLDDNNQKFIYVEMAFFRRWWRQHNDTLKDNVKQLVSYGQHEFVYGGMYMHDKVTPHYINLIDQTTWEHHFILLDEIGKKPRFGWQIDPFNHLAVQAYLFGVELRYDTLFFARIDCQCCQARADRVIAANNGDGIYLPKPRPPPEPPTYRWRSRHS